MRWYVRIGTASVTLICLAIPASAQLSDEDIATLQQRAQREGWTFEVGRTSATEYGLEELCGTVAPPGWEKLARFDPCAPKRDLPDTFDWRNIDGDNYLPQVRNQGGCGSCWAFATVGPLEANILIEDGIEVDLSEQWLVSCNHDGWDCGGGWYAHDYHQWETDPCQGTGAVLEDDFPYAAQNGTCSCPYDHPYLIDDWAYIGGGGGGIPPIDAIKQAIMDYGPVSVCVRANSAMQAYRGGIFNGCEGGNINHAVVLVGWDDNQGDNGVWFMRNSWGDMWGESNGYGEFGYMRIPYGCSSIGYAACYVRYQVPPPTVVFDYPAGRPEVTPPTGGTFRVNILPDTGVPVPGTGELHYRLDGGSWTASAMHELAPNEYEVAFPPADCFAIYDWYISVQIEDADPGYDPADAPNSSYAAKVGQIVVIAECDFEFGDGWTVENSAGLTDGAWDRGVPVNCDRGDPPGDCDGSGQCFLTDNSNLLGCNSDVDGGYTWLISPTLDLSAGDADVRFDLWYTNNYGYTPRDDVFVIWVSNDDGATWTEVETVGPGTDAGWFEHSFSVGDFVTPTAEVKVRFEASDLLDPSVVEAGLDGFFVSRYDCFATLKGDLNCDGEVNFTDINPFVLAMSNPALYEARFPGCPFANRDINEDGKFGFGDINPFVSLLAAP